MTAQLIRYAADPFSRRCLFDPLFLNGGRIRYRCQRKAGYRVIISGHPAMPLDLAPQALMDDHLLSIAPEKRADRRHQAATIALPIAWSCAIDMPGIEAERAMVAMTPPTRWWTDKRAAMTTLELITNEHPLWPGTATPGARLSFGKTLKVVNIFQVL